MSYQPTHKIFVWFCSYFCGNGCLNLEFFNSEFRSVLARKRANIDINLSKLHTDTMVAEALLYQIWCDKK